MPSRVEISHKARRQLDRIPEHSAERIWNAIVDLKTEPIPRSARKLAGAAPQWRLRVGEYRVIYSYFPGDDVVIVDSVKRRTTTTYKGR